MIKGLTAIGISILLALVTGCASTTPDSASAAQNSVTIETDEFNDSTWIKTPLYLSRQGFTDTFPVRIALRAYYQQDDLQFIQLYVTKKSTDWGFYHSANGQDGTPLAFVEVDNNVDVDYGLSSVHVDEDFALVLPRAYLDKMSAEDWKIKVYGKRDEGVFVVPRAFTQGFLNKIECHEAGTC